MRIGSMALWSILAWGVAAAASLPALAQTHRQAPEAEAEPAAGVTPTTGTIDVTFTVTLKTAFPTGSELTCFVNLAASSINSATHTLSGFRESNVANVKITGTTATCTVSIPYSWPLPGESATVMNDLYGTYEIVAASGSGTVSGMERASYGAFLEDAGKLPATGSVNQYAVAVTL